jgi:heme-degrading monooxygenase HmoA
LRGRSLIVRVLTGRVPPEQVAPFHAQARVVIRDLRKHDGLLHTEVARQVHSDGGEEIILVSVWSDFGAIYSWLGVVDLLDTPMTNGGEPSLFERFDVQHYEVLDMDDAEGASPEETRRTAVATPLHPARILDHGA